MEHVSPPKAPIVDEEGRPESVAFFPLELVNINIPSSAQLGLPVCVVASFTVRLRIAFLASACGTGSLQNG